MSDGRGCWLAPKSAALVRDCTTASLTFRERIPDLLPPFTPTQDDTMAKTLLCLVAALCLGAASAGDTPACIE